MRTSIAATAAALALAAAAHAAPKIIDSVPVPTFDFGDIPVGIPVNFAAAESATGVAITGEWQFVSGDLGGGSFPWSLDMVVDAQGPSGQTFTWGPNIGGDVTIASYPIADFSPAGFAPAEAGAGAYTLDFRNIPAAGGVSRLTDGVLHLTVDVPDVSVTYTGAPDPATSWNRPFFIEGVSGLGPVSYDAFEFSVEVSGGYSFTSTLDVVGDHFSFIYKGSFDPANPLDNLLDYGLGNGFSPFEVPRGTSAFETVLLAGETYIWVTSQWGQFSPLTPFTNEIVGPGDILADFPPCAPADITTDGACNFGTGDGVITLSDFACYLSLWAQDDPNADITATGQCIRGTEGDGVELSDFSCYLSEWAVGCP